jgi:hypothetical protein
MDDKFFRYFREFPEIVIVTAFSSVTAALGAFYGLPIVTPGAESLGFIGLGFVWPLFGVLTITVVAYLRFRGTSSRDRLAQELLWVVIAIPCYFITLMLHFNMKLWIQFINPTVWDASYYQVDQIFASVLAMMIAIRQSVGTAAGFNIDSMYLNSFLAMFYTSFLLHLLKGDGSLRQVFIGTLLLHSLGSATYLIAPALGPFIFEPGVNAKATAIQAHFLTVFEGARSGGVAWLNEFGPANLLSGLAAMPSLHAGGSWLFVQYAIRYLPWLLVVYIPLFCFIMIEAVATHWHYLIDLPFGIALAIFCFYLSGKLRPMREGTRTTLTVKAPDVQQASGT